MGKSKPSHTGLREHLPLAPQREQYFRWRGNEVSRIEGFTDSVFGFAVTLLVIAIEVPHTFESLMNVLRVFPAFIICFAFIMMFWNAHYSYHRRYGIESAFTRVMTMAILVQVLFFVYPLKYLFTLITVQLFGIELHNAPYLEGYHQVQTMYLIYGLGLAGIWGLYAILYVHALRLREQLQLNEVEIVITRQARNYYLIHVGACLLSITLALLTSNEWLPGVAYFLLGPLQGFNGWWLGRQVEQCTMNSDH